MWQLRRRREAIAAALQAYEESPPVQPANISIGIQAHSAEDIVGDWNRDMEEAIAAADAQEQQAKAALARAAKCETLHPLTSYRHKNSPEEVFLHLGLASWYSSWYSSVCRQTKLPKLSLVQHVPTSNRYPYRAASQPRIR